MRFKILVLVSLFLLVCPVLGANWNCNATLGATNWNTVTDPVSCQYLDKNTPLETFYWNYPSGVGACIGFMYQSNTSSVVFDDTANHTFAWKNTVVSLANMSPVKDITNGKQIHIVYKATCPADGQKFGGSYLDNAGWMINNSYYNPAIECDFSISPYPAGPGTNLTLTDESTGGEPTSYAWYIRKPSGLGGSWDNDTAPSTEISSYTIMEFGQYEFWHEIGNAAGTDMCWYPYWSGNTTPVFNITPTLIPNTTFAVNVTNLTSQLDRVNITFVDRAAFRDRIGNQSILANVSGPWIAFVDDMTDNVNTTVSQVLGIVNPFNMLIAFIMPIHNLYVLTFLPLIGMTFLPLSITASVVAVIPVEFKLLITAGLIIDAIFLLLRGAGGT